MSRKILPIYPSKRLYLFPSSSVRPRKLSSHRKIRNSYFRQCFFSACASLLWRFIMLSTYLFLVECSANLFIDHINERIMVPDWDHLFAQYENVKNSKDSAWLLYFTCCQEAKIRKLKCTRGSGGLGDVRKFMRESLSRRVSWGNGGAFIQLSFGGRTTFSAFDSPSPSPKLLKQSTFG